MNNLIINENTKIIASNIYDDRFLATNDETADFNTLKSKCFIIDSNKNIVSQLIYIGAITKQGDWMPENIKISELNIGYKRGIR